MPDMHAKLDDIAVRRARARPCTAEADLAREHARASRVETLIAQLKLEIDRLRRELRRRGTDRTARLTDPLELEPEEIEAKATDEAGLAEAAPAAQKEGGLSRRRPARKPVPDQLLRERVLCPDSRAAPAAAATSTPSAARQSPGSPSACSPTGRLSSRCARSSPAANARGSPSRRRHSTPQRRAGPAPA
jgi:hypothetical protein